MHITREAYHGNNIGRRCCGTTSAEVAVYDTDEGRVLSLVSIASSYHVRLTYVVSYNNASTERAAYEEECKAHINSLERGLDVDTRPHGFRRNHGNILGSDDTYIYVSVLSSGEGRNQLTKRC